ncbi:hypothetical protein [Nocardia brasiliensis]|uniref:hypothetical protein n=1 Tax=Nocardia brasiliensis TaxID=37326 RepID=UPI0036718E3F
MAYVVTLTAKTLSKLQSDLRIKQRLTKAYPEGTVSRPHPRMVLVVQDHDGEGKRRTLSWMGVELQRGTVGPADDSITIDPLREVFEHVPLDGESGLLAQLPEEARQNFNRACRLDSVGSFDRTTWERLSVQLLEKHPALTSTLEWLLAQADPELLDSEDAADRSWQEQRDAVGTVARIAGLPPTTISAWKRPAARDAPYLAGLIPEPVEHSHIDHDARASADSLGLYGDWIDDPNVRCDIHVFRDAVGRKIEIANINATPAESRLGADMIYYHEPTSSFMLLQYKRLPTTRRSISVDERLMDQLDRLEKVSSLSKPATKPDEWRLSSDACFLKLAYWPKSPEASSANRADSLTPGMYLPVSYVRLLLANECTLSGRERDDGTPGRMLGYQHVPRHLVSSQFIELIQHGLAGTVGVTVEQLRQIVDERVRAGHDTVLGREVSQESSQKRQSRLRSRGTKKRVVQSHRADYQGGNP